MNESLFCSQCGASLETGSQFCNKCGHKVGTISAVVRESTYPDNRPISPKSATTALLLCLFLGTFGIHRFYVGKIGTGILMLLTLGGFGIWVLVDIILIASCEFRDSEGKVLEFGKGQGSIVKRIFLILGTILAAFFIYIGLVFFFVTAATSGLVTTVENQLNALRADDISKAYSYTSSGYRKTTSLEQFKTFVEEKPILKDHGEVTFPSRGFNNNTGEVTAELQNSDGGTVTVKFDLIKENNEWKIYTIKVEPQKEQGSEDLKETDASSYLDSILALARLPHYR
jgi:TM2 domain-containing membrane protein YozV